MSRLRAAGAGHDLLHDLGLRDAVRRLAGDLSLDEGRARRWGRGSCSSRRAGALEGDDLALYPPGRAWR